MSRASSPRSIRIRRSDGTEKLRFEVLFLDEWRWVTTSFRFAATPWVRFRRDVNFSRGQNVSRAIGISEGTTSFCAKGTAPPGGGAVVWQQRKGAACYFIECEGRVGFAKGLPPR